MCNVRARDEYNGDLFNRREKMTDTKWRSPTGHSISSDVTDKLPPKTGDFLTRGQDNELLEALKMVMKPSTNFRLKAPNYMIDYIDAVIERAEQKGGV